MLAFILLSCVVAFYWGRMLGLIRADFAPNQEPRHVSREVFR